MLDARRDQVKNNDVYLNYGRVRAPVVTFERFPAQHNPCGQGTIARSVARGAAAARWRRIGRRVAPSTAARGGTVLLISQNES